MVFFWLVDLSRSKLLYLSCFFVEWLNIRFYVRVDDASSKQGSRGHAIQARQGTWQPMGERGRGWQLSAMRVPRLPLCIFLSGFLVVCREAVP